MIVNSSIFNKSGNSQVSNKSQNNKSSSSPISYLKNFKKSYNKSNQENVYAGEPIKSNNKQNSFKQEY